MFKNMYIIIFCTVLSTITNVQHILGLQSKPMLLTNEIDVPTDSIIERRSKKYSITECTMQCLRHHPTSCCGVGFLSEEMVDSGVWDLFTCFLLKKLECSSNNNAKMKLKVVVSVSFFVKVAPPPKPISF